MSRLLVPLLALAAVAPLVATGCRRSDNAEQHATMRPRVAGQPDVPFVKTPDAVLNRMLELAEIRPDDVVYDLGCGDGKIVIAAAKAHGVKAIGIEIDAKLVEVARENAKAAGVDHLVTIRQGDIFEADFGDATVVMMYLLPEINAALRPKLAALREGTRIVSHSFPMRGAKPEKVETVIGKKIYFWRVPLRPE